MKDWLRLKFIDIAWRFHPRRWCWASMVFWAFGYQSYWERPKKCGCCYACMTKREIEEDMEKHRKGQEKALNEMRKEIK